MTNAILESYDKKRALRVVVAILIVLIAIAVLLTIFWHPECENFECFQKSMERCNKVTFINEGPEASWGYSIVGRKGSSCIVDVKLLQVKAGELGVEQLAGKSMSCSYDFGQGVYPEKDLDKCHGLLKEDLQKIIIEKLHKYLIENLGKLDTGLNSAI